MSLFHIKGVHETGLDEILKVSGTGKGQFYHYFKDKDDLIRQVLIHFAERLRSGQIPLKQDLRTWDDLEGWFRFFIEAQKGMACERNCPVATIATDLGQSQDSIRREAVAILDAARDALTRFFELKKAEGELPNTIEPEALADFCYTIMQGGMLLAKVKREITPFERAVVHAMSYVKSLRIEPRKRKVLSKND